MPPKVAARQVIRRLEASVSRLRSVIQVLAQQQAVLKARSALADAAVEHCTALLALGGALKRLRAGHIGPITLVAPPPVAVAGAPAPAASAGSPPPQQQPPALPSGGPPSPTTACAELLLRVRAEHVAAGGVLRACPDHEQACPDDAAAPHIGWDPTRAAQAFTDGGVDLTTAGLRRAARDFVRAASVLCPRIRSCAPDAGDAVRRLGHARARFLELPVLMMLSGNLLPLSDFLFDSLDIDDPLVSKEERARRQPSSEVPVSHWIWAARQLRWQADQEETVYAALQTHVQRMATMQAQMQRLLEQVCAADDIVARDEAMRELGVIQRNSQMECTVTMLCVYASLTKAHQFGEYLVAAWPYMPSLSGLYNAMTLLREERRRRQRGLHFEAEEVDADADPAAMMRRHNELQQAAAASEQAASSDQRLTALSSDATAPVCP